MSRSLRALALSSVVASLALAAGCLDLDEQSLIHDLRILAVKTEPAELVLDSAYAVGAIPGFPGGGGGGGLPFPAADGFTVDIEVFAFDPRAGLVSMTSFLCPDGVDSTCVGYVPEDEVLADVEDEEERAELEALFLPTVNTAATPDTSTQALAAVPLPKLRWELTPSVISKLTASAFGSASVGVETIEPRVVLDLATTAVGGVTKATAFKRIPMIWDLHDPALDAAVKAAIAPYGIELCPVDEPMFEEEGIAPCARVREANKNPVLLGFDIVDEIAEADAAAEEGAEPPPAVRESTEPQLGPHPTLLVEPGGVLKIRPVFAPGSVEKYQVIVNDPNTEETYVEDRLEDFAVNWFVTRGSVEFRTQGWVSSIGAPGDNPIASVDGRWQLPTASELAGIEQEEAGLFGGFGPPGEGPDDNDDNVDVPETRDTLVVVVKDQRGGTTVGQITVEYQR